MNHVLLWSTTNVLKRSKNVCSALDFFISSGLLQAYDHSKPTKATRKRAHAWKNIASAKLHMYGWILRSQKPSFFRWKIESILRCLIWSTTDVLKRSKKVCSANSFFISSGLLEEYHRSKPTKAPKKRVHVWRKFASV